MGAVAASPSDSLRLLFLLILRHIPDIKRGGGNASLLLSHLDADSQHWPEFPLKISRSGWLLNLTASVFCAAERSGVTWPRRRGTTAPKSTRTLPSASWGEEALTSSATSWWDVALESMQLNTAPVLCIGEERFFHWYSRILMMGCICFQDFHPQHAGIWSQ